MLRVFSNLAAVFLIGVVIKLMDDLLDEEYGSIAHRLGSATMPYALVLGLLAAALEIRYTFSLFAASYTCGMMWNQKEKLPTELRGWQESLIMLVLSIFVAGISMCLVANLSIITVQIIDDLIDYRQDLSRNRKNTIHFLGEAGAVFVIVVCVMWGIIVNFELIALTLCSTPLVIGVMRHANRTL